MKLTFIGAAHEVTGSCHYLEACGKHILIDCGMEQGTDRYENQPLPVPENQIDYVLLTHAHIDHSGLIPKLCKDGFRGQIFATNQTTALCNIMLRDSAHIQEFEAEWKNRKGKRAGRAVQEPMYEMHDALNAIELLVPCSYDQKINLCDGIWIRFTDVGHLLGSACIEVWITEDGISKKIVFSGDIGNYNQPILKDPGRVAEADYAVIESTYGTRLHSDKQPDYVGEFVKVLKETFDRGGNVVIPAFAVGRTQEMLYFIREIKARKMLPEYSGFEVYVDSPLAIEATKIFNSAQTECFDEEAKALVKQGINPLMFDGLKIAVTSKESQNINFIKKPKVIISASGMCEAGRIKHHLKHNLWRKECTILFVGYQAEGTLGRRLMDGAEHVKIFGEVIEINADIKTLPGISGHADKKGLLDWVGGFTSGLERVFVVHGDDEVTDTFAHTITEQYGYPALAPYSGGTVDLAANKVISAGEPILSRKTAKASTRKAAETFKRVIQAANRLMQVALKNEGAANKDLAKFETQIHNLADKWDRDKE